MSLIELIIAVSLGTLVMAAALSLLSTLVTHQLYAQSDVLTGCDNYDSRLGALDPSAPATSFMFCESGGSLYFYQFSACPPILPPCAGAGGTVVGSGVSHLSGVSYFSRPAPGLVRFACQATVSGQSQTVDASVAFNAAAGANQ